jgi:hypothetical protein
LLPCLSVRWPKRWRITRLGTQRSLKVVIAKHAIIATTVAATSFESGARIHMDKGPLCQVSPATLCRHGRPVCRASRTFRMDSLGVVCWSVQKPGSSSNRWMSSVYMVGHPFRAGLGRMSHARWRRTRRLLARHYTCRSMCLRFDLNRHKAISAGLVAKLV